MTASEKALEIAACALYEATLLPFLHIQAGVAPAFPGWEELNEHGRYEHKLRARKALESPTFADYYAWDTLLERQLGPGSSFVAEHGQPPEADDDTERTRGRRAEYYLVHHLLRVDDAALLTSDAA